MKLEQSFTVTAPVEQVWAALVDVERVAPCLPGAEITGQTPDGGYEGTFTVKLGPATAAYRGSLRMQSLDEAARVATMSARGTDKRGQGGASATIVSTLRQEGDETQVEVVTDFTITGRLARFGRGGMIEDISKRLMRDFAQCLQATLTAEPAPPAAAEAAAAARTPSDLDDRSVPEAGRAAPLPGEEPADTAAAPLPGEEPADTAAAAPPGEEPAGAETAPPFPPPADRPSPAPGMAAEPERLPGDAEPAGAVPPAGEEAPVPRASEPDPWGPVGPPSTPAAPGPAATGAPPRTGSIPPPSAAPRTPVQSAKPVKGFSLLLSVLWERVKRLFAGLLGRGRKK